MLQIGKKLVIPIIFFIIFSFFYLIISNFSQAREQNFYNKSVKQEDRPFISEAGIIDFEKIGESNKEAKIENKKKIPPKE